MSADPPGPSLAKRAGAAVYDLLISLALMLGCAFLLTLAGLPPDEAGPGPGSRLLWQILLPAAPAGYFLASWVHGGQTLGLRAWKLRVATRVGHPVTPARAVRRLLAAVIAWAPAGLGTAWVLIDPKGLAWQDRLSGTRLVEQPCRNQRQR